VAAIIAGIDDEVRHSSLEHATFNRSKPDICSHSAGDSNLPIVTLKCLSFGQGGERSRFLMMDRGQFD
jgi:hypothetical protein